MDLRAPLPALVLAATSLAAQDTPALKPLPHGVFVSIGGVRAPADDPVRTVTVGSAADGVILGAPWNLCGDDQDCLLGSVRRALDSAAARGLLLALAVSDGGTVPPGVAASCQTFAFTFRGTAQRMCLPWDASYLAAKTQLVRALGAAFDGHPALAYVYFTGACSTNGNEGHCHVDEAAYTQAGYTPERLAGAYLTVMAAYREAFPRTPLAFEVHALFGSALVWERLWTEIRPSGRVGVAAWWCAERLSVRGQDTVPVWPLVQDAADASFAVCQTVGSFTQDPASFSERTLGLDYAGDPTRAFTETLDWAEGKAVHAGQSAPIGRFSVLEPWWPDANTAAFQERLSGF